MPPPPRQDLSAYEGAWTRSSIAPDLIRCISGPNHRISQPGIGRNFESTINGFTHARPSG